MRAALRHLAKHGAEALKSQKIITQPKEVHGRIVKPAKEIWLRPVVSKRVGNDLRKKAIREGSFGTFNAETGVGWMPEWDLVLKRNSHRVTRYGGMHPPKKTKRERTRQERAEALDQILETRLEKVEEHYVEKEAGRVQEGGFEAMFKRMTRGTTK